MDLEDQSDSKWRREKQLNRDTVGQGWDSRTVMRFASYILTWYVFSVSLSVYNKWMFSVGHLDFRFPIFTTACHQLVQLGLANLVLRATNAMVKHSDQQGKWWCGIASASDIGLGNWGMRYTSLSLYTMIKSSSLAFVLVFGVWFGLEKLKRKTVVVVSVMTIGMILMLYPSSDASSSSSSSSLIPTDNIGEDSVVVIMEDEPEIDLDAITNRTNNIHSSVGGIGWILVLLSSMASGIRWALTKTLLKGSSSTERKKDSPLVTIMNLSPTTAICLLIFSAIIEGPMNLINSTFWQTKGLIGGALMLAFPGCLAFCMTWAEFLLLGQASSVLALSIAGIFKELLTIFIGLAYFGESLSFTNMVGLLMTLTMVLAYTL